MNSVRNLKHVTYLCGDYNIDLLKVKDKAHYCEYYDEIISHGFFPKITLPTTFSDTANTLIDNIFATNNEINDISGILLNRISDHQLVFTRVGVKYCTCTWYLYLSTYLSVLDVLQYLVYGNAKVLVLVLVLDQKVLGTYK